MTVLLRSSHPDRRLFPRSADCITVGECTNPGDYRMFLRSFRINEGGEVILMPVSFAIISTVQSTMLK